MNKEQKIEKMIKIIKPLMNCLPCVHESGACELTSCKECRARELANKICEEVFLNFDPKDIRYVCTDDYGRPLWYECPECKKSSLVSSCNDIFKIKYCQYCGTDIIYKD